MMVTLSMGPDFERTISELSAAGLNILKAVSDGLKKAVEQTADAIIVEQLSGQGLERRTGMLAKNVSGWLEKDTEGVIGVKSPSPVDAYKWLLGGETKTILPKTASALAIPIGENLTAAGVARWPSPADARAEFGKQFFRLKGRDVLGYKKGKTSRAKFRPLFALKKSVTVTASGALADGVADHTDDMTDTIQQFIDRSIK